MRRNKRKMRRKKRKRRKKEKERGMQEIPESRRQAGLGDEPQFELSLEI